MSQDQTPFDLVVIGGGPGGYASALYGAAAGLNVALVERAKMGGTCLHVGCIPAKQLLETAAVMRTVQHAADFGVNTAAPTLDLGVTQARKQEVIDTLAGGVSHLLSNRKVTVFDGSASLHGNRTVRIAGGSSGSQEIMGTNIVLASGSVPRTLPGFDIDGTLVVTSDELLSIDHVPARAVVVGGGAIGCEFASFLADWGSEVTILEYLPQILGACDGDVTRVVERAFKKRNITVKTGVKVTGHQPGGSGTTVNFESASGPETLDTDLVVMSVGRRPFPDLLGLDGTAVTLDDRNFVVVDEYCRTNEPGVYALGDLINTPQLAHVAFAEAILVIKKILGEACHPIDHSRVPWAIYCHPEVAFAGHTEESAAAAGYETVVSKHRFIANSRAKIINETDGLVKVIAAKQADGSAGQILGVHMAGPWVTEQLGQGYLAVNWEATVDEVAEFIQPHPSLSELFGETILSLTGRSLHG